MEAKSNPFLVRSVKEGAQLPTNTSPITPNDVVMKSLIMLGVIVFTSIPVFLAINLGILPAALPLAVGGFGGLIVVLIAVFKKQMNNPAFALIYSALEGLFLGAITSVVAMTSVGASLGGSGVIFGAVIITFVIFTIMLTLYRTGFIRVNKTFIVVVTAITLGIAVVSLLSFALSFFGMGLGLRGATTLGILFSVFCIIMASLNLCIDFKNIDQLVQSGASKEYAWGAAFGLVITLVWLYVEVLILLRNLTSN